MEEALEESDDLFALGKQLEHNLASLLLKMQTILHIPESAVQEVIKHLCQIHDLSQNYCTLMSRQYLRNIIQMWMN